MRFRGAVLKRGARILFIRVLENHVFLDPEIERSIAWAYRVGRNLALYQASAFFYLYICTDVCKGLYTC
jgi:hypothetical protein